MDITKMTITELKAAMYDQLVQQEQIKLNLKMLAEELVKRQKEAAPQPVEKAAE